MSLVIDSLDKVNHIYQKQILMDQAHIHLLITHLPIFGSILGGLVLAYGIWSKSDDTKIAAYFVFIISSLGAAVSYLTGEGAEEVVEDIQGVAKNMIDQHEDFAGVALAGSIVLGVFAIIGLYFTVRKSSLAGPVSILTFVVSLVCFGLTARTGYLGGQIRHTEIGTSAAAQSDHEEEDD
jgi:uncharacterized membrane protein